MVYYGAIRTAEYVLQGCCCSYCTKNININDVNMSQACSAVQTNVNICTYN